MESYLQNLFINILNMSITGSYVILFVILTRQFFKKMPKIFSYSLWAVVLFRLVCPFSFSSALSFFNVLGFRGMEHIPADIGLMAQPEVNIGINSLNQAINNSLPVATPIDSVNPMQVITAILSVIWLLGVLFLLVYSVFSYLLLKRKVSTAILSDNNVFKYEKIQAPFVLGIIKPKIYLPVTLNETEKSYILRHEQIHIRRLDHIIKPLCFIVLCIHWFNPLVWVGFVLMSKDMEMSCDERVLKEIGINAKKDYSSSLLNQAVSSRRIFSGSPIAFGENSTKSRIKNVLNYKKPAFWMVFIAIIACITAGIICIANPIANTDPNRNSTWEKDINQLLDSGKKTDLQSINDIPDADSPQKLQLEGKTYYVYEKNGKFYSEQPYQSINEITEETYRKILEYITPINEIYKSIINELSRLPKKYTVEEQVKDGCLVVIQGRLKSDPDIMERFMADTKSGRKAAVTIVQHTDEGDPIVTKVIYDGVTFYGVTDNSRDAFKGDYDDYIKFQYKYLKIFEENNNKFGILVNDNSLTVEEYRKSTLSSNSKDWIDHYFLYSMAK